MRRIIINTIRLRNPAFVWPVSLSGWCFLSFVTTQLSAFARGCKTFLYGRHSYMMLRGKRVTLIGASKISWGKYLKLGDNVYINAVGIEGVKLGHSVGIGAYSRLIVSGDITKPGIGIRIGNNVGIGEFAYLGGAGGLHIDDHCIVGQYFSCHPENHEYGDVDIPVRLQGTTRKGISIGKNCWIGSKVTILDGVTVGDNCVIAAGAVVNRSFPSNSIIAGVPARVVRTIKNERLVTNINSAAIELADAI